MFLTLAQRHDVEDHRIVMEHHGRCEVGVAEFNMLVIVQLLLQPVLGVGAIQHVIHFPRLGQLGVGGEATLEMLLDDCGSIYVYWYI